MLLHKVLRKRDAASYMEMAEQIRLFASAKLVIAQHGAGLSNIVTCAPGTHVVEIGPVDLPCYLHLAEGLQQVRTQADCEEFCDEIKAVVTELYPASAAPVPTLAQQADEGASERRKFEFTT